MKPIKKNEDRIEIEGYPIIKEYKYLGITIIKNKEKEKEKAEEKKAEKNYEKFIYRRSY